MTTPAITRDVTYQGSRAFGHSAGVRCLLVEADEPITKPQAEDAVISYLRSKPQGKRWSPLVSSYGDRYSTVIVYCRSGG